MPLINGGLGPFQTLLNPTAPRGVGNVHELGADGSAIDAAGLLRKLTTNPQFGMRHVGQETEGIEIGFEVSPMTERVENALAVGVGVVQNSGDGGFTCSLSSSGQISSTRITDDAGCVLDSGLPWSNRSVLSTANPVYRSSWFSQPAWLF